MVMQNCFIFIWMNACMHGTVCSRLGCLLVRWLCECVDLPEPSQSPVQSRLNSKSFMNILKYMHRTCCIRVFELKIQSFNVVCMHDSKQYLHYTLHYFVRRKRRLCRLNFLFWDIFFQIQLKMTAGYFMFINKY